MSLLPHRTLAALAIVIFFLATNKIVALPEPVDL
jgi:hypothetical protein